MQSRGRPSSSQESLVMELLRAHAEAEARPWRRLMCKVCKRKSSWTMASKLTVQTLARTLKTKTLRDKTVVNRPVQQHLLLVKNRRLLLVLVRRRQRELQSRAGYEVSRCRRRRLRSHQVQCLLQPSDRSKSSLRRRLLRQQQQLVMRLLLHHPPVLLRPSLRLPLLLSQTLAVDTSTQVCSQWRAA